MAELQYARENCYVTTHISSSNNVSGTYYYPDSSGGVGIGSSLTFQIHASSSSGSITSSFWATNDPSTSPEWFNVTPAFVCLSIPTGSFTEYAISGSSGSFMINYNNFPHYKYRLRSIISGSNINKLVVFQTEKKIP